MLFQNLSLSDLLFVTICIPPTAVDYAVGWPLGPVWCKLVQFLVHATTYASVYTLVLLSLDRYLVILSEIEGVTGATALLYTFPPRPFSGRGLSGSLHLLAHGAQHRGGHLRHLGRRPRRMLAPPVCLRRKGHQLRAWRGESSLSQAFVVLKEKIV